MQAMYHVDHVNNCGEKDLCTRCMCWISDKSAATEDTSSADSWKVSIALASHDQTKGKTFSCSVYFVVVSLSSSTEYVA